MRTLSLAALLLAASCASAQAPQPATPSAPASQAPAAPAMKAWFVRLIPPRTTFLQDITVSEKEVMGRHLVYLKALYDKGTLVFGGPVLDPKGVYGVLVIKAASEDEARAIAGADPSVQAGVSRIEVAEMRVAFPPKSD